MREFGLTLFTGHAQVSNKVLDAGRRFGIRPTRKVMPEAREMRDHLIALRGRAFDREFVRHVVDGHRKDVDEFRDEAREHHGPVSDLAVRQLPTLREYLRTDRSPDRDNGRFDGRPDHVDWRDPNGARGNDNDRNSDRYGNNR